MTQHAETEDARTWVFARWGRLGWEEFAAELAEREKAAGARLLVAIADEWVEQWIKEGRHHGRPGAYSEGYERDLRARAAALDGGSDV